MVMTMPRFGVPGSICAFTVSMHAAVRTSDTAAVSRWNIFAVTFYFSPVRSIARRSNATYESALGNGSAWCTRPKKTRRKRGASVQIRRCLLPPRFKLDTVREGVGLAAQIAVPVHTRQGRRVVGAAVPAAVRPIETNFRTCPEALVDRDGWRDRQLEHVGVRAGRVVDLVIAGFADKLEVVGEGPRCPAAER